ncbi:period circadian regulator isoform X11 [Anticarsia gemmatalis]|uniref:period circadian regulator isoform X11 n=1 Tax=Anticarsia gemmatalis TaxID=129554 RepID=UPI003F77417B
MDNLDDSENNAKISDSAYSNSCSNSQSRRSHSSKSTHSGSNSSGSSGYGGKPSTSGSSNNLGQPPKKEKEAKKKKQPQTDTTVTDVVVETEVRPAEPAPTFDEPNEETDDVMASPPPVHAQPDKGVENMDVSTSERNSVKDEVASSNVPLINAAANYVTGRSTASYCSDGFSCVISMHDGVVMYTTSSLTATLGFPKDMWIGRSFIDFIHPRDRSTFASQITSGLAIPKIVNAACPPNSISTLVCRIRRYRGLMSGFGVKDRVVTFMPFLLKLTFKNICDEEGKVIYLVIQATPFFSAFRTPFELVPKPVPFVIRHAANGNIEYVDPESVPYLGYLPQDLADKDALALYHPEDLNYLRQVYETIVKEGGLPRSKPYRMMTQNGDYLKLETEWSSFINPWSRKLEFVIGKHHIIEGPSNPDVFHSPDTEKPTKVSEEEKNKAQMLRENIVRTMNEVLTKPAELAKQQMTKRCQDLATFMESLMEEQPKTDEELRLEIQDPDNSYFERDSVMLGGISPHHDYNDSKSSTETPLSYNQLNYNDTLQRYFDSHQLHSYEDYNTVAGENILGLKDTRPVINHCLSPMAQNSGDSGEMTSSCDSNLLAIGNSSPLAPVGDYVPIRLTESLLTKHNAEMEKELVKIHRETRSSSKGEREKATNKTRQKQKEHLARCNASFQPTDAIAPNLDAQPHGVKRASKQIESETNAHKHHCSATRQSRRRQRTLSTSAADVQPSSTITTTVAASHWPTTPVSNMNTFILGVGIPQQMSIMSPMPGMFPMYYAPAPTAGAMPSAATASNSRNNAAQTFQAPAVPCMMYGQPMYGQPFMYSPINPQVSYPVQQTMMAQSMQYTTNTMNPLGLTSSNYEESTEAVPDTPPPRDKKASNLKSNRPGNVEEPVDKTDGESSYSSFYSSFFKTESGSAEESGDAKKAEAMKKVRFSTFQTPLDSSSNYSKPDAVTKAARRKMEPPWMEQVCVTSELIYKYQVLTKTMEEVLSADKKKMDAFEQPSLVNDQLGQLYLDLQLEGVAARLTLEEGVTSSSSSGEETTTTKGPRRKREYSKLVMIYEEDAPLPPPAEGAEPEPEACSSTNSNF